MEDVLVRAVELPEPGTGEERTGYPWDLPAVQALGNGLDLGAPVTYLIGENGSGKSTLLEAIAIAAGMNPEGGSSGFAFSTRDSHSELGHSLRLIRGARRPGRTSSCGPKACSRPLRTWSSSKSSTATRWRPMVAARCTRSLTVSRSWP